MPYVTDSVDKALVGAMPRNPAIARPLTPVAEDISNGVPSGSPSRTPLPTTQFVDRVAQGLGLKLSTAQQGLLVQLIDAVVHMELESGNIGDVFSVDSSPYYSADIMKGAASRLRAVAKDFGLPVRIAKQALEAAAAEAARETAGRAKGQPRPKPPRHPPSKAAEVFGHIPPALQTKTYTRRTLSDDVISDPEVIRAANRILNAYRRRGDQPMDSSAVEKVRMARRIVRAHERRHKAG